MDMNFQSVFDDAVELEKSFDTIFGAEEDDDLMGVVLGEAGDDDVDFDTLDDGETAKELKDDLEGKEIDKPTIDSNDSFDIENDAKTPGENVACDTYGVADAVEKSAPDEENIEGEIEKSENKSDIDDLEESFLDTIFSEESSDPADPGEPDDLGVEKDQINDNEESDELEDNNNPVNSTMDEEEKPKGIDEGDGAECKECPKDDEVAPTAAPIVYDNPVEEDEENLDDVFKDEEPKDAQVDPVAPDGDAEAHKAPEINDDIEEGCSKVKKEEDINAASDEGDVATPDPDYNPDDDKTQDASNESANLDDIFSESDEKLDAESEDEKVEDEIIDAVNDDNEELSDAEAEDIADEGDEEEDELIAMILDDED